MDKYLISENALLVLICFELQFSKLNEFNFLWDVAIQTKTTLMSSKAANSSISYNPDKHMNVKFYFCRKRFLNGIRKNNE